MSGPYILSQPVLKTFFSCMKSCSLSSHQTISRRRTWFVARVRNVMSGKKLKEESANLSTVGSRGTTTGRPQGRPESGHRVHEIVQERSFVSSGANPAAHVAST